MDTVQDVLMYQTQTMPNSGLRPYVLADLASPRRPPDYTVLVDALFYASLGVMLLVVFIAMLIESWVHEFDCGSRAITIPEQRAKTHEFRYFGMGYCKLHEVVVLLPSFILISLL